MTGCAPFQIHISGSLEDALTRAKQEAAKQGVVFKGDAEGGHISGLGITGKYAIIGRIVTITVTQMGYPAAWKYDCHSMEAEVRRFFGG